MASTNNSIPLAYVIWIALFLYFGSVQPCLCFHRNSSESGSCIERERKALLIIQKGIYDAQKWLSWDGKDCCRWRGVQCDTMTGHVVKLDLHHLYPYEYVYDDVIYVIGHPPNKSEVSPSLLRLRHLNYLDLSMNYFGGAPIPDFIGSLANLEYLNLSNAGFGGTIPHQLGNLSNLHYLDLTSKLLYLDLNNQYLFLNNRESLNADNLDWLAQIRSLQHLDMSYVNLSKASNWIHAINMLPSLSVLCLPGASLSSLPSTLPHINFTSLSTLDLFGNNFASSMPGWLFNLSSLKHLDLGRNHFHGNIPLTIGNLKRLQDLDLSMNNFNGEIPETVWSLKSLRSINLQQSLLSRVELESMGLQDNFGNRLSGRIPETVGTLKSLESLDLRGNSIRGEIPKTIGRLTKLRYLWLGDNNITGRIPDSMYNLRNLVVLDLSSNIIREGLSEIIGNLPNLQELYLSYNQISGEIPETVGNLHHLEELYLDNNLLTGVIPGTVGNLCNLSRFYASDNNISGEIAGFMEGFSRCSTTRLSTVDLHGNNLSGPLPSQIGELQGALTEAHFANLTGLFMLDLSHNSLTVNVSQDWLPPFKASEIKMRSCPLGPKFPPWLRNQTNLSILDLSSAGISENFPDWFWDMGLPSIALDVSHNQMKGKLPTTIKRPNVTEIFEDKHYADLERESNVMVTFVDLSNNSFSGPIPPTLASGVDNLGVLLLAHNRISGSIPSTFCEARYLEVLNLADNNLSGVLPDCWNNSSNFSVIDFSDNKLSGCIPSSMGFLSQLSSLHLRNNNLSDKIPLSLKQCRQLITIDLGNNKLSGSIPEWIGESLSSLRVLRLRSNMLDGNIPMELSLLASLQVLDLADNKLSGTLPPSFGNFNAMIVIPNGSKPVLSGFVASYYTENLLITMKNLVLTYTTMLSLVASIDLSNNNISGEIPNEFTHLYGLVSLNLSGNQLTLCWLLYESKNDSEMLWLYVGLSPGFVVGFWGFLGAMMIKKSTRFAYIRFIDKICEWIYMTIIINSARPKSKRNYGRI